MKTRVQIIASERRENVYEGNRKSVTYICQTVVFGEKTEVGVLRVPLALAEPLLKDNQLMPGFYELEYGVSISFQDRSVSGRLVSINMATDAARSPIGRLDQHQQQTGAAAKAA